MQSLANFEFGTQYKDGKQDIVTDAITRRPDYRDKLESKTSKIKLNNMSELPAYTVSSVDATELNKLFDETIEKDEEYKQFEVKINFEECVKRHNRICKHLLPFKLVLLAPSYLPLKNFIINAYHSIKWTEHLGRDKTITNTIILE